MSKRSFPKFEEWFALMHGEEPEPLIDTKSTPQYQDAVKQQKLVSSDALKEAMNKVKGVSTLRQNGIISGYKSDYIQAKIDAKQNTPSDKASLHSETTRAQNFPKLANDMLNGLKTKYPQQSNGKNVVDIANDVFLPNDEVNARNKIRKKLAKKKGGQ